MDNIDLIPDGPNASPIGAAVALLTPAEDRKRVAELSKKLNAFAKLGLKADIEHALAQGARLDKSLARGDSAAMAAMRAGHRELAEWLFGQDGHAWRKAGGSCEFFAALDLDDPTWLAWLHAKRPRALSEEANSPHWSRGKMLVVHAMKSAPRCLAWLIEHCPKAPRTLCPHGARPIT